MKENRTYDQVFGDLKQGNGDPSLTLFGRDVTPNQHALAEQFVLLDNLYCSGEVSQDGQPWTTSAYATEFTQRAWTLSYSRHGSVNTGGGIGEQSTPYIWELARQKGLKVKTFGMGNRRGVAEVRSTRFDQRPADPQLPRARDYERADRFVEEFQEMDRDGTVPNFMFMSLGENHTSGTAPGAYTPKAQVASNDVARRQDRRSDHQEQGLEHVRHLHHRRRRAEWPRPRRLPSHGRARDQPVRQAQGRRQRHVLHGQHAAHG